MTTLTAQLQKYYDEMFPIQFVMKFLSHDKSPIWRLENREIMFTIPKVGNKESYCVRYLTAETEAKWRALFTQYNKFLQIDVGGVFMIPPSKYESIKGRISIAEVVKYRELIFDVDLSEYKDVRYCCGNSKRCCKKCWPLAVVAMRFVDKFVRECFGLTQLVWLFSGRRGVHCWVMDDKAGSLTQEQREAIVSYITDLRKTFRRSRNAEYHALSEMAAHCEKDFTKFIEDQQLFSNKERFRNLVQGMDLPSFIVREWIDSPLTEYSDFKCLAQRKRSDDDQQLQINKRKFILDELMMQCVFPKLDIKVTTQLDHLLKVPFSVHPGTSMICMPLTKTQMEQFDPTAAESELNLTKCTRERIEIGIQAAIEMFSKK